MSGVLVLRAGRLVGGVVLADGLGLATATVTEAVSEQLPALAPVGAKPPCGAVPPAAAPLPVVDAHCVPAVVMVAVIVFEPVSDGPVVKSTCACPFASVVTTLPLRKKPAPFSL